MTSRQRFLDDAGPSEAAAIAATLRVYLRDEAAAAATTESNTFFEADDG